MRSPSFLGGGATSGIAAPAAADIMADYLPAMAGRLQIVDHRKLIEDSLTTFRYAPLSPPRDPTREP